MKRRPGQTRKRKADALGGDALGGEAGSKKQCTKQCVEYSKKLPILPFKQNTTSGWLSWRF
jgi:hypothetical protein